MRRFCRLKGGVVDNAMHKYSLDFLLLDGALVSAALPSQLPKQRPDDIDTRELPLGLEVALSLAVLGVYETNEFFLQRASARRGSSSAPPRPTYLSSRSSVNGAYKPASYCWSWSSPYSCAWKYQGIPLGSGPWRPRRCWPCTPPSSSSSPALPDPLPELLLRVRVWEGYWMVKVMLLASANTRR